jgi:hypothetical protein
MDARDLLSFVLSNSQSQSGQRASELMTMKEAEARQIIERALVDNGRHAFVLLAPNQQGYFWRYESTCSIEELAEQIAYRLKAQGAFHDDEQL